MTWRVVYFFIAVLICMPLMAVAEPKSDLDFNVGVIIPLTGDLAEYGSAIKNGFELAAIESPEKFSNIKFIYEDSKYDGKTAVSALQKLRTSKSIDVYYLWGVSPTEAMLPIAVSQKLAVIAETTVKDATVGKPLVVRAARTGERIAKALASELARRKVESVSFIVTEIPFYLDIIRYLEIALKEKAIVVTRKREILPSEVDFKSFFLNRSVGKNEAEGVFLLPSQFTTFFRQAAEANQPINAFNADILDSQTIVESCPDNIDGTFFTHVGVTSQFRDSYKRYFHEETHVGSAAQSYDLAMILSKLFGKLDKKLSPEEIIEKVSQLKVHTGVTGTFSYTETIDGGKELRMPVAMREVRGKKIETITDDTGF